MHFKYAHQNTQSLTNRSDNDIVLVQSVKDIKVGVRMCKDFEEFPDKHFFGRVTKHFVAENLWHVNYDDGDEEDMTDQEVLDAVNLCMTLYASDKSADNHDTPNRTTPVATSVTPDTSHEQNAVKTLGCVFKKLVIKTPFKIPFQDTLFSRFVDTLS